MASDELRTRLRHARQLGELSCRELARLAGLSPGYPALIEAGERERVGSEALAAITQTLGISMDWLVTGEGPSPKAEAVKAAVAARREAMSDQSPPDSTRTGPSEPESEAS